MTRGKIPLLLAVTTLILSGCTGLSRDSAGSGASGGEAQTVSFLPEGQAYLPEWGETLTGYDSFSPDCLTGEAFYYKEYGDSDGDGQADKTVLYRQAEGQEPEELFTLEDALADWLLVDGQGAVYCLYDRVAGENRPLCLLKLGADGSLVYNEPVMLPGEDGEAVTANMYDAVAAEDGRLCACDFEGSLYFFDENGRLASVLNGRSGEKEGVSEFGLVGAGAHGCYWYTLREGELALQKLDLEKGKTGKQEAISLKEPCMDVYDGGDYGLLLKTGSSLKLYEPGSGQVQKVLGWGDRGLGLDASRIGTAVMGEDGTVFCLFRNIGRGGGSVYQRLSLVQGEAPPPPAEENVITLGVAGTALRSSITNEPFLMTTVKRFNYLYPDFRVELVEYDMDRMDFTMDLLRGKGPDLILLAELDAEMLEDKGVLEDLAPYLEKSGKVREEDLLSSVVRAMKVNGKTVRVFESFQVPDCFIVKAGTTRGGGWTPEEFLALADGKEDVCLLYDVNPMYLFMYALEQGIYDYVDWGKRECRFADGDFARLLEKMAGVEAQARKVGLDPDWDKQKEYYLDGRITAAVSGLDSDYLSYRLLRMDYGEDAELAGLPNGAGEVRYRMWSGYSYGMNSASEHKDAAWAFLEMLLSEDYQQNSRQSGFPVRWAVLEEEFETDSAYYGGLRNLRITAGGEVLHEFPEGVPPVTEEEMEEIRYILEHAYASDLIYTTIYDIAWEEAQTFFAGDKTADEAAALIQNRVSLFLQE